MKTSGSKVVRRHTLCDDVDWRNIEHFQTLDDEMIHKMPAPPISTMKLSNIILSKHMAIILHTIHALITMIIDFVFAAGLRANRSVAKSRIWLSTV